MSGDASKYDLLRHLRLSADISVPTLADLHALQTFRRKWGVSVYVYDDGVNTGTYKLTKGHSSDNPQDNLNWVKDALEETDPVAMAAIGDRTYTEQNCVTNNESVTESLDALDICLGAIDESKWEPDTAEYQWGYGYLYNWYVTQEINTISMNDSGWRFMTSADWTTVINWLSSEHGIVNTATTQGAAMTHLMSCRQVNSPLGGSCDTSDHPRYNSGTYYGLDTFNIALFGGGTRGSSFGYLGLVGVIWTSSQGSLGDAFGWGMSTGINTTHINTIGTNVEKYHGMTIRLIRAATAAEQLLVDGTYCNDYIGNDGKRYKTVKIGTQVWLAANLAETKYRNGDLIPFEAVPGQGNYSNAQWAALTTPARCAYSNNEVYVTYPYEAELADYMRPKKERRVFAKHIIQPVVNVIWSPYYAQEKTTLIVLLDEDKSIILPEITEKNNGQWIDFRVDLFSDDSDVDATPETLTIDCFSGNTINEQVSIVIDYSCSFRLVANFENTRWDVLFFSTETLI